MARRRKQREHNAPSIGRDDPRLCRARAFIDASLHLPLDLEQIAAQAYCSRFHVIRLFRRGLDQTPHQYLTRRRIERAKALLLEGERSVSEVCLAVGFRSVGSFSALFSRAVGTAPSAYRAETLRTRELAQAARIPLCFLRRIGGSPTSRAA